MFGCGGTGIGPSMILEGPASGSGFSLALLLFFRDPEASLAVPSAEDFRLRGADGVSIGAVDGPASDSSCA